MEALDNERTIRIVQTEKLQSEPSYAKARTEQTSILRDFLGCVHKRSMKEISDDITRLLDS